MGNCIGLQKPVTWVDDDDDDDDDWGFATRKLSRKHQERAATVDIEEKVKAAAKSTEMIRIKISKKQLEELLKQVDAEGLPLLQVLAGLGEIERHWRPKLQSIPEVAESNEMCCDHRSSFYPL